MWKRRAVISSQLGGYWTASDPIFFVLFLHFKICGQMWNSVRYRAGGLLGCLRPKRRGSRSVESAPLLPPTLLQPRASWEISQSQILTNFPIWTSFVAFYLDFYVISTFWFLGTWCTVESVNFYITTYDGNRTRSCPWLADWKRWMGKFVAVLQYADSDWMVRREA